MIDLLVARLLLAGTLFAPADGSPVVVVECPARQTTRLVFPEALHALKVHRHAKSQLGLTVERSEPLGIIVARPPSAGPEDVIEFRGPTTTFVLRLKAAAQGNGSEIRIERPIPAAPALPTPEPTPSAAPREPTAPLPTPAPPPAATAAPPAALPAAPDAQPRASLDELLQAQVVTVGRREGLPGEREMVLVDALKGRSSVWLRFLLEGGAGERLTEASSEQGRLADVVQEPAGKDLRIIVALPREALTKRSIVSLRVGARTYEFSFSAAAFRGLLKALEH
jgi:hypothetical protein